MNMTTEQQYEWANYLNGDTNATPPVFALLAHWAEVAEKGQTISWGPDRAAAILAHIASLEAEVEKLRETIAWNRTKQGEIRSALRLQRDCAVQRIAELEGKVGG